MEENVGNEQDDKIELKEAMNNVHKSVDKLKYKEKKRKNTADIKKEVKKVKKEKQTVFDYI